MSKRLAGAMSNRGCRVYIGNMPSGVREKDLERFFKKFGRPNDFLVKQGFGFVEFDDYRDADDAVYELNGKVSTCIMIRLSSCNGLYLVYRSCWDRECPWSTPGERGETSLLAGIYQ